MIRLPALIQVTDKKHCSPNCQFINFENHHDNNSYHLGFTVNGYCIARGHLTEQIEHLEKDGELYLRTLYCIKKAMEDPIRVEQCLKCKGRCEGETYSSRTKCTNCGARFVRIADQDETYLTDADEFDKREREDFEKEFERRRTK